LPCTADNVVSQKVNIPTIRISHVRPCRAIQAAYFGLLVSLATLPAAAADPASGTSETRGDFVLFSGPLGALISADETSPEAGATGSRAGWHLPGRSYRSGDGWWALVCGEDAKAADTAACRLHGTHLSVSRAKHAVYDAEPVPSQFLYWSPLPADLDKVPQSEEKRPKLVAIFKPIRNLSGLKLASGPVATYVHQGMTRYPDTGRPGTLEVRLALPDGQHLDIVPRIAAPQAADIATFELRLGERRQRLPGYAFSELGDDGSLTPPQYLLWAGDLDGDGKPDLILNHGGYGIHVAAYLSSLAKEGELVGFAGSFQYADPSSSGC
jgi:hypothetical protein